MSASVIDPATWDDEWFGELSDRDPAQIHERLRLDKQYGIAGYLPFADFGIEQGLTDGYRVLLGQLIQDQETRIVPVQPIPASRVS